MDLSAAARRSGLDENGVSSAPTYCATVTYVPPTRDAHRGETRLRGYKYDYELHIPEA
jgi:hypothetical protein